MPNDWLRCQLHRQGSSQRFFQSHESSLGSLRQSYVICPAGNLILELSISPTGRLLPLRQGTDGIGTIGCRFVQRHHNRRHAARSCLRRSHRRCLGSVRTDTSPEQQFDDRLAMAILRFREFRRRLSVGSGIALRNVRLAEFSVRWLEDVRRQQSIRRDYSSESNVLRVGSSNERCRAVGRCAQPRSDVRGECSGSRRL